MRLPHSHQIAPRGRAHVQMLEQPANRLKDQPVCLLLEHQLDPDNRLLLNLQLGQLNASCELGIIKSALPVCEMVTVPCIPKFFCCTALNFGERLLGR